MKITIIGNSVGLRIRPNQKAPLNKNYSAYLTELIDDDRLFIENKSVGAITVTDITVNIDIYINSFPDYYLINLGVVDSCSREVPLWFYRIATSKKDNIFSNFFHVFYRELVGRIRPIMVWLRFKKPWLSRKKFLKHYELLVRNLLKETNAQLVCIGINLANDRIEKQLPGSRIRQIKYNEIITDISKKYQQYYIDTSDLDSEKYYPDGVHYNIEGHRIIAERIKNIIKKV